MDTLNRIDMLSYDKAMLSIRLRECATTLRVLEATLTRYGALYDISNMGKLVASVRGVADSAEECLTKVSQTGVEGEAA